ncbi:hypothetical protein BJX63DRAFT_428145 [Aspergillus granulosus]|uniref:NAD-dependent epimerase/dehydratase domain-containing protein n=1 Tax=Aspergillus granulosus TaxID=176169 RepID=A0ABR4HXU6_9EURO
MSTTPQNVLVTGANGYLGLHVLRDCLAKGWTVVGAVRTIKAANRIRDIFPDASASERLVLVQISDIVNPSSLEPAFSTDRPITAVINLASPLISNPSDIGQQVLDPAIHAATAVLEAGRRYGGNTLRRIVHTSSCAAVLDPGRGDAPGYTYTSTDWNPTTYEEAATKGDPAIGYMASKALSERAAWDWIRANQGRITYDFTCIAPAGVLGPHYLGALVNKGETLDLSNLNLSSQMLWYLADPNVGATPFNFFHLGCWVAANDASAALAAAVVEPAAAGRRFICAQRCHWQLVKDAVRAAVPELRERIDVGTPGATEVAWETTYDVDGSEVSDVLGIKYTSLEDTMRDTFAQFLEAEKQSGKTW